MGFGGPPPSDLIPAPCQERRNAPMKRSGVIFPCSDRSKNLFGTLVLFLRSSESHIKSQAGTPCMFVMQESCLKHNNVQMCEKQCTVFLLFKKHWSDYYFTLKLGIRVLLGY
jgi:hypothetical protein